MKTGVFRVTVRAIDDAAAQIEGTKQLYLRIDQLSAGPFICAREERSQATIFFTRLEALYAVASAMQAWQGKWNFAVVEGDGKTFERVIS